MATTTLKEARVHRDVSSTARAATVWLRPHLALADLFRLGGQPPVAPRLLRGAARRTEADGVTGGRVHGLDTQAQPGRAHTGAGRGGFQTRPMHGSFPGLGMFLARSRQAPTGFVLDRPARVPRPPGLKQFPGWSRSLPALPVQGRKLLVALVAPTPASTGASPGTRSVQAANRTAPRHVAANLWRRPRQSSVVRELILARAVAPPGFLRRAPPSAGARVARSIRVRGPAPSAGGATPRSPLLRGITPGTTWPAAAPRAMDPAKAEQPSVSLPAVRRSAVSVLEAPGSTLPRRMPAPTTVSSDLRGVRPGAWRQVMARAVPAAPRMLAQPSTTASIVSAPPPGGTAAAVPHSPVAASVADGGLDATRVARWLARALGAEAARPPAGGAGFDPRRTPAWTPSSYAKVT